MRKIWYTQILVYSNSFGIDLNMKIISENDQISNEET